MEPSANTRNAKPPSAAGETLIPERRSSNTFGRAKVVDKTMLESAVVRNTIADTRMSSARISIGGARGMALTVVFARGVMISRHVKAV
jgi:hypothetical protein